MQYDFIAIGDTVVDAFIRLKEATVQDAKNTRGREICMRFGDKIPYEEVTVVAAVGNSANAAVSAARLGLTSALVTNIGKDYYGEQCLAALREEKVGENFVAINDGMQTNYHFVLWFDDDRTILIKHQQYPYHLPEIGEPKWLYLSSLGENSGAFHGIIEKYLTDHPAVKLAFQPGTFQMKMGKEQLRGIYARTEVLFCNTDEAQRILGLSGDVAIKKLLADLHGLGPKIAVITDGPKGAYASDGAQQWFMPPYPDPKPPYERTGAGDAFSSAFTVALALGLPMTEALRWAPINAMSVVQQIGARAGLLTREKIEGYLKSAPTDYKPKPL